MSRFFVTCKQLGDHGEVDGDTIATFHPHGFQLVGDLAHVFEEVGVGPRPIRPSLVALPQDGLLFPPTTRNVAINCVEAHIGDSPREPLDVDGA